MPRHSWRRGQVAEASVLKVPGEQDQVLVAKTYKAEQEHVFRFWATLSEEERRALLDQLAEIDFQLLARLAKLIDRPAAPVRKGIGPVVAEPLDAGRRVQLAARGREALSEGRVAALMVAGGLGTRLGWEGPKGTFPVGPVSGKSLYQLFAEQLLARGRRAGRPIPWIVLCSRANLEGTRAYFAERRSFGLDEAQVRFLVQREMPSVDARGKVLLESRSRIATSPNGHGGALLALWESGALADLAQRGVEHIFYWQVDNPLCLVLDPVFLGAHIAAGAEASTKVVEKTDPAERIGLLVSDEGRTRVIEYTEMSKEQQEAREEDGKLRFRAGNTAIHALRCSFLERLRASEWEPEYHVARKPVRCIGAGGEPQEEPNAVKLEAFVFDVLPEAQRHLAFQVAREEEFEPLKNASGDFSPDTVRAAQSRRAAAWLAAAGVALDGARRGGKRKARAPLCEVEPLTALDADDLKAALSGRPAPTPKDGKLLV